MKDKIKKTPLNKTSFHMPEHGPMTEDGKEIILSVKDIDITFGSGDKEVKAVKNASFDIYKTVPGVGNVLTRAINYYDNGVIIGVTLFYASLSVISVILGDILMATVDPRISLVEKGR